MPPSARPLDPVVVCGAGAAGLAAALSAAAHGRHVWLVESRPLIGGTVAHALIHTLGGLFDADGNLLNYGLSAELIERLQQADPQVSRRRMGRTWVFHVAPDVYARVTRQWIGACDKIRVICDAGVSSIVVRRQRVTSLTIRQREQTWTLHPTGVIDATGTAEVARMIDPCTVEDDLEAAAGGWIFTLRHVAPRALDYPKNLGLLRAVRSAVDNAALPIDCGKAWFDLGTREDEVYVKLFVPLRPGWIHRRREILSSAERCQAAILQFVRQLPEFAEATLGDVGELGVRDGGRIVGEYRLTAGDVRSGARFSDAVCRCAWPIEYWHPAAGVSIEYLDGDYDIPLRALTLKGYQNVWAAGKCLSADRLAQASARVVGTCWAMGEAAGRAAALRRELAIA